MKIVDLIREKTQKISAESFSTEALELQVRELRSSLSERFALARNSDIWGRFVSTPVEPYRLTETSQQLTSANSEVAKLSPAVRAYHENLMTQLGEEVHRGEWFEISQQAIETFAGVTQDTQWIHIDGERAHRESPFRSTVAQGFFIVAMIPALREYEGLVASANFPVRMVVNCGVDRVRFLAPVKPGNRIRARATLKKVELNRKFIEITEDVTIEIEAGIKCACRADIVYRVYV